MLRYVLHRITAHRARLALTALSIVLGVSFVAGAFVFTDTIDARFSTLFDDVYAGVDLTVRPEAPDFGTAPDGQPDASLPAGLLDQVVAVDGVRAAAGAVGGVAQLVVDGEPIGGQGPPTLGASWVDHPSLSPLRIADGNGRAPVAPGEVVVDVATAEAHALAIGDAVVVQTATGTSDHEIVGLANFGTEDNLAGATLAVFELGEAQRLLDLPGRLSAIDVVAADDVAMDDLRDRLAGIAPTGVEVVTGDQQVGEEIDAVTEGLGFLSTALLAFAAVAVFVAAFVIHNTFRIVVAQRVRELGLLRAIGATGRQLVGMVVVEALAIGTAASGLGVVAGIGVAAGIRGAMGAVGLGVPEGPLTVLPRTVVVAMAVGIVVTLAAALAPARRAATVAPVEALAAAPPAPSAHSLHRRGWWGAGLALLGIAAIAVGLAGAGSAPALLGAAIVVVALLVAAPALARPVAGGVARLLPGVTGRLAHDNVVREPRRTATTATALTVGVLVVTVVSVLAASMRASVADTIASAFPADLAFQSTNLTAGVSPDAVADLAAVEEYDTVSPIRLGELQVAGEVVGAAAVDGDVARVYDLGTTTDPASLGDGMLVAADVAEARGWSVGDDVEVAFPGEQPTPVTVAGTFTDTTFASYVVAADRSGAPGDFGRVGIALVSLADGVDLDAGLAAADPVLADWPALDVNTRSDQVADAEQQVDGLLTLVTGLLVLAVVIAVLGIANTLSLSIVERGREVGLLRAIGMTSRQVRRMVRGESVVTALFGALLGVTVGSALGWVAVRALADQGLGTFDLPVAGLATWLLVAAVAGVVAAATPARRAGRLDVLVALAEE